jgi:transcriptional regulator of met regulon
MATERTQWKNLTVSVSVSVLKCTVTETAERKTHLLLHTLNHTLQVDMFTV